MQINNSRYRPWPKFTQNVPNTNVKCKAIKLPEEHTGENLRGLEFGDEFVCTTKSKKKKIILK